MRNAWKTALVAAVVATGSAGLYQGWSTKASAQAQSDNTQILLQEIALEVTLMRSLMQKQLECQQCIAPQSE
jgi:hypothetical protein